MMDDFLMHIGKGHKDGGHSGRYPWGSGENPYQRYMDFYTRYRRAVKDNPGISDEDLANKLGIYDKNGSASVAKMKRWYKLANSEHKAAEIYHARKMAEKGMGSSEIGRELGKPESTIRGWLDESKNFHRGLTINTVDTLKTAVDKKKYLDVSSGSHHILGVSESKMKEALDILKDQGYHVEKIKIRQQGTDHNTTFNVLTRPDVTYSDLAEHRLDIKPLYEESRVYDNDGNLTKLGMKYKAESIDSKRIAVRYNEEGGAAKDGLIELRPGVKDITIGASRYAQIRMGVDDTHYIKGMAIYSNDVPPGFDILINSNKHVGTPLKGSGDFSVLKKMKTVKDDNGKEVVNWDNPFGASIPEEKQKEYIGDDGKKHPSKCNIVYDEGDWGEWKKRLSSQFLSKQPKELADRQLTLDTKTRQEEFEEIKALTNPIVKQKLLIQFADGCDRAAVELKGAPLPGQKSHVILPFPEIPSNECYAPQYDDGTVVALIRHPHEGTFAIPILTVHNKGSVAAKYIGDAPDAIGINKEVADRLSGADFDGDSVIVIPQSSRVRVRSTDPLEGLKDFDAKEEYPGYPGMKTITNEMKQREMGIVSNLITDMTFQAASADDLARATRHSQCIIDAEKHNLNWKLSYEVNGIEELKKTYQKGGGASTIISRAKSPRNVERRKDWWERESTITKDGKRTSGIDPETGEKVYEPTNEINKKGKLKDLIIATGERVTLRKQTGKGEHAGEYYYTEHDKKSNKDVRRYVKEGEYEKGKDVYLNDDKKTGKLFYLEKDPVTQKNKRIYVSESDFRGNGIKIEKRTQELPWMSVESDAYKLTSGGSKEHYGYHIEKLYADYANNMKALANEARKEYLNTKPQKKDPEASVKYAKEVMSLNKKLQDAEMNAPRERQAQLDAAKTIEFLLKSNPEMSKEEEKRTRGQAINASRLKVGAKKKLIELTDSEWEAVQKGAVSPTKLRSILDNCDLDVLKEKATPRKTTVISPSMEALAKAMKRSGHSARDIANRLGISPSSVYKITKG